MRIDQSISTLLRENMKFFIVILTISFSSANENVVGRMDAVINEKFVMLPQAIEVAIEAVVSQKKEIRMEKLSFAYTHYLATALFIGGDYFEREKAANGLQLAAGPVLAGADGRIYRIWLYVDTIMFAVAVGGINHVAVPDIEGIEACDPWNAGLSRLAEEWPTKTASEMQAELGSKLFCVTLFAGEAVEASNVFWLAQQIVEAAKIREGYLFTP